MFSFAQRYQRYQRSSERTFGVLSGMGQKGQEGVSNPQSHPNPTDIPVTTGTAPPSEKLSSEQMEQKLWNLHLPCPPQEPQLTVCSHGHRFYSSAKLRTFSPNQVRPLSPFILASSTGRILMVSYKRSDPQGGTLGR